MRSVKAKIIALLSDPEVSNKEFNYTLSWLRQGGIDECEYAALKIRNIYGAVENASDKLSDANDYLLVDNPRTSKAGKLINYIDKYDNNRIYTEVTRLLLIEAGLTKGEAIHRLNEKLNYVLPENTRDSFNSALIKLSKIAGQSNVLSAAQIIRNQLINSNKINAWPLREDIDDTNN